MDKIKKYNADVDVYNAEIEAENKEWDEISDALLRLAFRKIE